MTKAQDAVKETKKTKRGEVTQASPPSSSKKKEEKVVQVNSEIKACIPCKPGLAAKYQDQKYGKHQRVHVRTRQSQPIAQRRLKCTVCGVER